MQFGIFGSAQASTQDLGPETGQGFRDYLDYAVEAEALGYRSSFLVEHHFTGWNQVSATLMLQTALAMRTTTLRLGTAVIVLPWHNPVLLAEQAATLDLISGGRLDFGIGKGYRHNEFAGFRIPPEEAEPRFEESVEVMTKAFVSRAALLAPRQILAVRRHRGRAAAGAAAASAVLGRGRQRSLDPPRRAARLQSDPRPVRLARGDSASASRSTARSEARAWRFDPMQVAVARQLYVAKDKADAEAALAARGGIDQAHRRRVARAGRQGRLARAVPMPATPGAPRPTRFTARRTRSARGSRRSASAGVEYILLTMHGGKEQLRRFAREVMPAFAGKRALSRRSASETAPFETNCRLLGLLPAPHSPETITFRRQDSRPDRSGRAAPQGGVDGGCKTAMAAQEPRVPGASRWWALFRAGKTTLLEAILARTGAIQRQGTVEAGTTVGDASKEARHHKMSVELTVATTTFMGDSYTFIDCPGSVEFVHDMRAALPAVDAAVVVCEADEKKMPQLQLILRELEDLNIPRFLFLNKIDKAETKVMEALQILQPASRKPLVMRQLPIRQNDIVTGFVDLALERVHIYKEHAPSEVVPLDGENLDRSKDARFSMLEKLADHDDELMEQLLADIPPPRDKVFDDLAKELRDGLVVPVLMGVATRTNGVLRLLKALRHEAPNVAATAKRLGVKGSEPLAYVLKTLSTGHAGKMSIARVLTGQIGDGVTLNSPEREAGRVSGTFKLLGQNAEKRGARDGRRDRRARQARIRQDRRHALGRQAGACRARRRSSRIRRCWRFRSRRKSARTTSSSARRCTSSSTRTPRSISCTTPRPTRW